MGMLPAASVLALFQKSTFSDKLVEAPVRASQSLLRVGDVATITVGVIPLKAARYAASAPATDVKAKEELENRAVSATTSAYWSVSGASSETVSWCPSR